MTKTLYIGNLPWATSEEELRALFAQHVDVQGVRIVTDRQTGRSRGFGFVDVDDAHAERAIAELNGVMLSGREILVTEAKSREPF